jgi:hypothetical protein
MQGRQAGNSAPGDPASLSCLRELKESEGQRIQLGHLDCARRLRIANLAKTFKKHLGHPCKLGLVIAAQ